MRRLRTFAAGMALALTACASVQAGTIADYRADYLAAGSNGVTRPSVSADGWDYMWNANAPIGTAAGNYSSLLSFGTTYNFDGLGNVPRPGPANYVYLSPTGGHPSEGGGTFDRFATTAYTVQPGAGGLVRITNSLLSVASTASNGVEARIYVNDNFVGGYVQPGGAPAGSFNAVLGFLNPGDTVYVALGPNGSQGSDSFGVDYTLETFSDSSIRFWDADGTAPVNGGTGNWHTAGAWADDTGTYGNWNNGANQSAVFLADPGTVTLDSNVTARSLSFSQDGYTIAGTNTLTLTTAGTGGFGPATIDVPIGTATISAPITGGELTKTGGGTLELTGNNTVTGITNIAGGTLTVSGTGAITTDRLRNSAGGVTLNVADSASITANSYMVFGDASGASMTVNQSGGTVTSLGTANSPAANNVANRWGHWSGGANVTYNLTGGTLNLLNAPLYLSWDGAATLNVSGGTANILGIDMGYNGRGQASTINMSSGTLSIGSGGIYYTGTATNKNINLSGGTLTADDSWSSSLNMNHTGTVWVDTNGHDISLSGVLSGGGSVNKIGAGRLSLTGGGSYGNLTVASGDATLGGPSTTTTLTGGLQVGNAHLAGGGSATLDIVDGDLTVLWIQLGNTPGTPITATINQTGGSVLTTGVVAENAGFRLGHYPAGTTFYNLSGGTLEVGNDRLFVCAVDGTGTFTQTGGEATATTVVVNARTWSTGGNGTFTVQGGTFNVGSGGIVNDNGPYAVNLGGLGGTIKASADFSSSLAMTLSGTGANAIHFDTNAHQITLSGALTGTGGLNKIGDGMVVLTSAVNNYTGPTSVTGGTLALSGAGKLYSDAAWAGRSVSVSGGGVLQLENWVGTGLGQFDYGAANLVLDNGTLRYVGSTNASPDSGSGRAFMIGAGGATLESANAGATWTINRYMVGATEVYLLASNGGLLTLAGDGDGVMDKVIPGSGGLMKSGAGTWTLTRTNTYTGTTTVSAGTLKLAAAGALGGTANGTVVESGGALDLAGFVIGDEPLTINGPGTGDPNFGAVYNSGGNLVNIGIKYLTLASDASIGGNGGRMDIPGGGWIHGGTYTLTKVGSNDTWITSPATIGKIIINGGTIGVQNDGALGDTAYDTDVNAGANLGFWGNHNLAENINLNSATLHSYSGSTTLTGTIALTGTNNINAGLYGGQLTFTGEVAGSGGFNKNNDGRLILTGNSTYTGATKVNGGTLVVDGSIATSSGVTVAAGATLAGHGTVPNVSGAGLVSPGNSPGILTVESSVDGSLGLDFAFEFNQASPDYGNAAASGNDVLRLTDASNPFTTALGAGNVVDIYLNVPDLAVGDTIRGGFYTDRPLDFADQIDGTTFNFYVAGAGGTVPFGGIDYFPLDDYLAVSGLTVSTVYDPANFGAGPVGGYVMQLTAVPEPASAVLAALGLMVLAWFGRRRRKGEAAALV